MNNAYADIDIIIDLPITTGTIISAVMTNIALAVTITITISINYKVLPESSTIR